LTILCAIILFTDLATAHGSFLINGWKVWTNASIPSEARLETSVVPVRLDFSSGQTLWIGTESSIRIEGHKIFVEKGSATLGASGTYALEARSTSGLSAGSSEAEMAKAPRIPELFQRLREERPMSQRP
jgi:hypothetical protein